MYRKLRFLFIFVLCLKKKTKYGLKALILLGKTNAKAKPIPKSIRMPMRKNIFSEIFRKLISTVLAQIWFLGVKR